MLEEAIQICEQMWSDNEGPYEGKYYSLAETICRPRPIQTPRPPILIGGGGEKKTLKLVAKYADACNLFETDNDALAHKLRVLDRHCEEHGRDPQEIQRTVLGHSPLADIDGFLKRMEGYAKLGFSQVWVSPQSDDPAGYVIRMTTEVLPRLSQI
jgi:alkanesulfonate monooxygenase SsuD/methylene tetrahydromethanopterin reductase-like flavin-dependent oxidoreductase (luciferase family)